jgi:hypothetical protein
MAMKYKSGDRVNFLNDTGGGIVNRIDDHGFVYVLTEDGFEIPVSEKELILSRNFAFTDIDDVPSVKPPVSKLIAAGTEDSVKAAKMPELPKNVPFDTPVHLVLGFIPENRGPVFASRLACYLVNDSAFFVYYMLGKKEGGALNYISSGFIEAETKCYITGFDQTSVSKISDIHIQLIFISKGKYASKEPVDKLLPLNLVNFSKESYFRENDYFEEKAVLFNIVGDEIKDARDNIPIPEEVKVLKNEADNIRIIRQKKKEPVQDTLEVDLHFDETGMQNSQLTPTAILALQMSRFHAAVEEAISKNLHRLVIIHGLGQGTLKMQIRKELQEKYPQCVYQDASFKEYGFGATMVHLTFDQKQ